MTSSTLNPPRTRRRWLLFAGVVVLVVLAGNLRVEATPPPAARMSLALALEAAGTDLWESAPVRADATVAGLSWEGEPPRAAWIRASADGAEWGPWEEITIEAEHGPDPGSPEAADMRAASEPMWMGEVEWVQYRVEGAPDGISAELVETAGRQLSVLERISHFVSRLDWAPEAAEGAPDRPTIVPRESWGGPQCNPNSSDPAYTDGVRMMFVHHTTTYNTYPAEDVPGIIYAMCSYHVDTRGWKDIGYNFVIDRFGTIYEARDGGIENAVWGAHTGGFNYYSFGVGLIGDHDLAGPSQAAIDALKELAAWKMDLHHVDPATTVTVESLGSSKYEAGVIVDMDTISGHLDASNTSCPGDFCYPLLVDVRPQVYEMGGAKIFGGWPDEVPPIVTEDVTIPFSFTEPMDWTFRLVDRDGTVVTEDTGSGSSATVTWDGMIDGEPAGRSVYTIEIDASTVDDGEVPTPVRESLQWYDPPFADDDFNRHEINIDLIAEAGITEGCSSVLHWLYCPDELVRRDQMASFIARAMNLPPTEQDFFSDDNGNSHEEAINALAAAGITTGCANDRFCPLEPIRRDHMAAFLARALGLGQVAQDYFDDDDGPYEANINALADAGITLGCGVRAYCPDAIVARDQMASFLARAFLDSAT